MVIVLAQEVSDSEKFLPRLEKIQDISRAPHAESPSTTVYRGPARDFEQLCRAFALVHDRYLQLGYMEQHESGMRYSLLNLLPQSTTFVVEDEAGVAGTLSVVIDSQAGLPGSNEFGEQFSELRTQGRIVAEATMFACREESAKNLDVSLQLMAIAFSWCLETGVDDLCMIVNPRHVGFYEKVLGFERLGDEHPMGHVEGHAGIMLRCNVTAILKGEGLVTRQAARLLKSAETLGSLSFNRFQLLEPEVSVLLDFCPEILVQGERIHREMVEYCFPLACAAVVERYGYVPSMDGLEGI